MAQLLRCPAPPPASNSVNPGNLSMASETDPLTDRASDSQTDMQLVRRAQRGEKSAFDLLVIKYQSRVGSIVSRYVYDNQEVLDLTQETFIKAYRAIDRFRGDSAFYTWLYRIAVNTAKNFLDSRGRRPNPSADAEDAEHYDDGVRLRDNASPERLMQRDQLHKALQEAIVSLPEELRSAFLLREYDGLSYDDIAQILECPIGTVRSRIFRARDFVDRRLGPLLAGG
ncbi:RNA polymerase sigma factor RpoE [Marinobacter sp. X15-166B]|nr:RNA polymerase sigma factor RpoE [Marinobacter sp. X15-166B]